MGLKFIQRSRLTAIPFNWSPAGNQFSLSRFSVKLSRKFKQRLDHCLAACEIRKSTIRKAGNGVFILEAAMKGQILFKYGGRRISFPEADRLSDMVRAFSCFVFKCIQLCYTCIDCNGFALDTHIKAISTHAFCYDSRPNYQYRMEWFVRNHLVGGFLNSNIRKLCNAKFLTVGDEVFVVATEGARRCLSITKFADGPNFMKCSLFRASE